MKRVLFILVLAVSVIFSNYIPVNAENEQRQHQEDACCHTTILDEPVLSDPNLLGRSGVFGSEHDRCLHNAWYDFDDDTMTVSGIYDTTTLSTFLGDFNDYDTAAVYGQRGRFFCLFAI